MTVPEVSVGLISVFVLFMVTYFLMCFVVSYKKLMLSGILSLVILWGLWEDLPPEKIWIHFCLWAQHQAIIIQNKSQLRDIFETHM